MYIDNYKIHTYYGKYEEYVEHKNKQNVKGEKYKKRNGFLEYIMAETLGKLSIT